MLNILVVRISAIGDVIHTLPCVFLLKKLLPHARISWVVQQKAASLLVNQPFLDNVYVLPDNFMYPKQWSATWATLRALRSTKWDGILDFQGITKTSILLPFLRGKKYGFDRQHARWGLSTYFTHKQVSPEFNNIIQKNLSLAGFAAYDLEPHAACPSVNKLQSSFLLSFQNEEKAAVAAWLAAENISSFIALCPNTTWDSKHWPHDYWVAFVEQLQSSRYQNRPLVVVGSSFGPAAKNLLDSLRMRGVPVHAMPAWNLTTTGYALKHAELVLAPDTGLLHLCDYLGVKTVGIFGPTLKKRHGPFLDGDNVKQALQIPCQHLYKKEHGQNHADCMTAFTPDAMMEHITSILQVRDL